MEKFFMITSIKCVCMLLFVIHIIISCKKSEKILFVHDCNVSFSGNIITVDSLTQNKFSERIQSC